VNHPDAADNTNLLALEMAEHILMMGGLRFMAGDFNFRINTLEVFQVLEKAGFRDIQDVAEERWGQPVQVTCKGKSRKDFCFLSPELQSLLVGVEVDDTIWADHAVLKGKFRGGSNFIERHYWPIPKQMQWPTNMEFALNLERHTQTDPSIKYEQLWHEVETAANQTRLRDGKLPAPDVCLGRAKTREVQIKKTQFHVGPVKKGRASDVQPEFVGISQQHAHWFRQLRRQQSYCRFRAQHSSDNDHAHGTSLWSSILRAKGFQQGFRTWWQKASSQVFGAPASIPLVPPNNETAGKIFESFQIDVRKLEHELRSKRRQFAATRRSELAHMVFKDIQRQSPDRVDLLLRSNAGVVKHVDHHNAIITIAADQPLVLNHPIYIAGKIMDVVHIHECEVCVTDATSIQEGDAVRQSIFTGSARDMFAAFEAEWKARWDRHKHVPPSQWEQICEFGRNHMSPTSCHLQSVDPQVLRIELDRKKPRSATGLDGVSLQDLKSVPQEALFGMCELYQSAEAVGAWPSQMINGKVASLAKTPNPDSVQSFRPITILSQSYRLWSSIRAKQMLRHMDKVCPAFLFGNRPHCQASQVWTHLAWVLEESYVQCSPMGGIVADIEKAFNHLPREVVFQSAIALGFPQELLVGWAGAMGGLVRRFQIRNHLSHAIQSTTGFPEGCALSCLAMMLMDCLFHKWFDSSFAMSQPISYVDDLQVLTHVPSQIPQMMEHLLEFARLVDLKVDRRKTFVWSNDSFYRTDYRRKGLNVKRHARGLGAQMHFGKQHSTEVVKKRLQELSPLWAKLRASASPYHLKVMAVKQAAWPRGLHGIATSSLSSATIATLRSQVMKGLGAEGSGCNPMLHLGCVEVPSLDPKVWAILETFRVVRESASEESLGLLIHEALDPNTQIPAHSLTRLLVDRIHSLGWTCTHGVCVQDALGEFSLMRIKFQELRSRVYHAWGSIVDGAVQHRLTLTGLSHSDFAATREYLQKLEPTDQGLLRKALNGANFTNDSIYHFSDTGTLCCQFCGAKDSRFHRFWECEVFQAERQQCSKHVLDMIPDLPPSLTCHGWALRSDTWKEWKKMLLDIPMPRVQDSIAPFRTSGQWIDIFTDGSCLWPCQKELRLASWAVVQAHPSGDPCSSQIVMAGAVNGLQQSAFRSELVAVLQTLKYAKHWGCSVRIWSDCQSVIKRLRRILVMHERPKINTPHADLWLDVFELLSEWDFQRVEITKVAAHQDSQLPLSAVEHWAYLHNSLADRAARLANLQRPASLWHLHKQHVSAVQFASKVSCEVLDTILRISRRVVQRESLAKEVALDAPVDERVQPIMSVPVPPWGGFDAKQQLPVRSTSKFGHRLVATIVAWFRASLQESAATNAAVQWVSVHQLYIDYQLQTGELGPICQGTKWHDPCRLRQFRLQPAAFNRRSSWFGKAFRQILTDHDCYWEGAVTRPASTMLALHVNSIALPWPVWRLEAIEVWLSQRLSRAATRDGLQLKSLPPAKQDKRWPSLVVQSGPLRP